MKQSNYFYRAFAIICIFIVTNAASAQAIDYLTKFKIPVQQTFCISKAPNGDMISYKECMLAIEKGAHKCDKETKPSYEQMFIKHVKSDSEAKEYMEEIKPIIEKHFTCLNTLY